jgi:hypothetical protein
MAATSLSRSRSHNDDGSTLNVRGAFRGKTLTIILCALLGVGAGSAGTSMLRDRQAPVSIQSAATWGEFVTRDEFNQTVRELREQAAADRRQMDAKIDNQTSVIIKAIQSQGKE